MPCKPVKGWQGILFFIISNISINNNGTHSFCVGFYDTLYSVRLRMHQHVLVYFYSPISYSLAWGYQLPNRVRYTNFIYSFFPWLPRGMYHFPSSLLVEIIFPQKITYMGLVYKWMGGISNSCVLAKAAPQGRQTVGAKGGPGPPSFFNKRTVKLCFSYSWGCPETFTPSMPHLTDGPREMFRDSRPHNFPKIWAKI